MAGAAGEFVTEEPRAARGRRAAARRRPADRHRRPGPTATDLTRVGFSRLSAKHRLAAWLELLALTATDPGRPWRAAVVGARGRSMLGPVSAAWAAQVLADLVVLRRTGLRRAAAVRRPDVGPVRRPPARRPTARPVSSSATWTRPGRWTATRRTSSSSVPRSRSSGLLAAESRPDEERGALGEPSRFGTLARRVFTPLLLMRGADVTAVAAPVLADFDLCGPLPSGTTVLEASAGTGKTYTIAALAARYLAEGDVELSQLMLVTFGRMATNELRLRVRDRLVTVEAALGAALAGTAPAPDDPLVGLLTAVPARRAGPPPGPGGPGAGRLRRRDHRHHPRVLPADARRARGARRPGAAGACSSSRSAT